MDHSTSAVYFHLYDGNGNTGQLINGSDGSIVAHYEYDPYGKAIASTGSYADENAFRFSSKYYDSETDLYYYGYRYYSPEIGRWISRDPVDEEGGINLYSFVNQNPVNYVDETGLWIYKGACRYISGGEIVGGAALRCMMWTECYDSRTFGNNRVQYAEIIVTFIGLTTGLPGSWTYFSVELDDGYQFGDPDIRNLTGLSYIVSAGAAALGGSAYTQLSIGKGETTQRLGEQVGVDASTDLFVGYSRIEGDINIGCCGQEDIVENADFIPKF